MTSYTKAAIEILKTEKKPLGPKEVVDIALKRKLIISNSKRPAATMAGRLYSNRGKWFESDGAGRYFLIKT
ncbi:MAG: winged helix-turn-helix domain-containing protein [Dehalococcoidales bacterium]|nr:winged helix-turn-helix domain-containing protein [Dehalococcoidales bacterium]